MNAGVTRYLEHYVHLTDGVRSLQDRAISDEQAKAVIYDVVITNHALPIRLAEKVRQEYFNPRHVEFEPHTAWSLHNAFTEVVKQIPSKAGNNVLPLQIEASQKVGRYFGLLGTPAKA